jgi:hypothetical protein
VRVTQAAHVVEERQPESQVEIEVHGSRPGS